MQVCEYSRASVHLTEKFHRKLMIVVKNLSHQKIISVNASVDETREMKSFHELFHRTREYFRIDFPSILFIMILAWSKIPR